MITIYHNPRCQKSREALALLEEKGSSTFAVRQYLKDEESMSAAEFEERLGCVRYGCDRPRSQERSGLEGRIPRPRNLAEDEIILAMIEQPALDGTPHHCERRSSAVVARPAEKVEEVL